jgi:hypothetical protein
MISSGDDDDSYSYINRARVYMTRMLTDHQFIMENPMLLNILIYILEVSTELRGYPVILEIINKINTFSFNGDTRENEKIWNLDLYLLIHEWSEEKYINDIRFRTIRNYDMMSLKMRVPNIVQ